MSPKFDLSFEAGLTIKANLSSKVNLSTIVDLTLKVNRGIKVDLVVNAKTKKSRLETEANLIFTR